MKKLNPAKFIFGFLGLSTFASLVGTVSGTLAWYAYSARAAVSYSGTSVSSAIQLQIGLASENPIPKTDNDLSNHFWDVMTENEDKYHNDQDDKDYYCYFANVGVGLDPEILTYFLKSTGYAYDSMKPVTTGYYDPNDATSTFGLKLSPTVNHQTQDIVSGHDNYMKLPFVFRAFKTDFSSSSDEVEYADPGSKIWLVDASTHPHSKKDGDIFKSVRMFIDRHDDIGNDFIIHPMAESAGETKVGGLLDLTNDQYFDYELAPDFTYREIIYGEYDTIGGISNEGHSGAESLVNPNGSTMSNTPSCFVSRHKNGIRYYDNLDDCDFKTAAYSCMDDVRPNRHPVTGEMQNVDDSKPTHVCEIGADHIAHVDLYLWLEGWDYYAVDDFQLHNFDFGLTFEINKI